MFAWTWIWIVSFDGFRFVRFKMEIQCLKNGWKPLKCAIYLSKRLMLVPIVVGIKLKFIPDSPFVKAIVSLAIKYVSVLLLKCIHVYLSDQVCQYWTGSVHTIDSCMHVVNWLRKCGRLCPSACLPSIFRSPFSSQSRCKCLPNWRIEFYVNSNFNKCENRMVYIYGQWTLASAMVVWRKLYFTFALWPKNQHNRNWSSNKE